MAHLGRYQQGHVVPLLVASADTQQTPAVPNVAPRCMVTLLGGITIDSFLVPILDSARATGLFQESLRLDSDYAPGLYQVLWEVLVNGNLVHTIDIFEVIAGGDPVSYVQAMAEWQRPEVQNIVMQTYSGSYRYGQNPSLPTQEV